MKPNNVTEIWRSNSTYGNWAFKVGEQTFFYFRRREAEIARDRAIENARTWGAAVFAAGAL
jgi:hypothetical protein